MTEASEPDPNTSVAVRLLALQHIDTQVDQLRVKRQRLPEREVLAAQQKAMAVWEQHRDQTAARIDDLSSTIEQAEARNTELRLSRDRLEAQMKTVIAPREAEALLCEIETVNLQRNELDDTELAALEEQAALDNEQVTHLASEGALRQALGLAEETLKRTCADIDIELKGLGDQRSVAAGDLEESVARRYESVRSSVGVAVAELKGHRCEGCHLDLSAAEVDTAKDESVASGYTDCPQCGRLLIV